MKTVEYFIFLGSKITADTDCNHKIKTLALWKKSYDKCRQCFKKQRHSFADKGPYSQSYAFSSMEKAMIFPSIMSGCDNWAIKKAECQIIDAFKLWVLDKTLENPVHNKEIK